MRLNFFDKVSNTRSIGKVAKMDLQLTIIHHLTKVTPFIGRKLCRLSNKSMNFIALLKKKFNKIATILA